MQPVDEQDCIARSKLLYKLAFYLDDTWFENPRDQIAADWLKGSLRRSANMWVEKSASVAVHHPIDIYNEQ